MRVFFSSNTQPMNCTGSLSLHWLIGARVMALALASCLGPATPLHAQPSLQSAVLTDRNLAFRQRARDQAFADVEGVEAGPLRFSVSASYSAEFNDNISTSESNPEGDLIQTPSLDLSVDVPLSERSDLAFQMGIGYQVYWHNPEYSRLAIRPGSELAYDLQVKNVFITLFDRISYTEDIATVPDVANQAQFPVIVNVIGVHGTWLPGDFLIASGYGYQIYRGTSGDFDYVNRDTHLPFLRAGYVFAEGAANSGLEFSVTLTDYQSSTNSDSGIVSFGPYLEWQLTDALQAALRGGFVYAANSLTIIPDETFKADSYYLGLNVDHALTDRISQNLTLYHGVRPSVEQGAAFTEETNLGYSASWAVRDPITLGFNLTYVHGQQSVAAGVAPSETYNQWRVGLNLSYALTTQLSSRLAYEYVSRDSNLANRSYEQNRATLELSYAFK